MSRNVRLAAIAWMACWLAGGAMAQTPAPTRIRGTIAAMDDQVMTVTTREGPKLPITLTEPLTVIAVKNVELSSIQPGNYVGVAAERGPSGQLQALEVLVFPESARGSGEGHRDWDLKPGSTMTNANVSAAVQGISGRDLDLVYKDGFQKVHVPVGVPVVTFIPAERADLKPGVPVFFTATKGADGSLSASRVIVGKDGVAPPM
jgi:hypothetical protein